MNEHRMLGDLTRSGPAYSLIQDYEQEDDSGNERDTNPTPNSARTIGTGGVFAPVCLSMFSTLLFLRIGYIVGNAGIIGSLLLLTLAYAILVSTVFSVSAIATNGAVEGGGAYFMISRTLGPELGGSIGILFYLANVVGSALYCTGCAEGLIQNLGPDGTLGHILPGGHWVQFGYASSINFINLVLCLVAPGMFGSLAMLVLLGVGLCLGFVLVSFVAHDQFNTTFNETLPNCTVNCTYYVLNGTFRGLIHGDAPDLWPENKWFRFYQDCEDHDEIVNFATVFAVLFSGVTGIMAGANLSGELKNPAKSIPLGTFGACGGTFFVYAFLFIFTGLTCNRQLLYSDCGYMNDVCFYSFLVALGVILTTYFASTSNLIGSSRVLQAIAKDDILGAVSNVFKRGTTAKGNPWAAVVCSYVIIQGVMLFGSLNKIAKLCCILYLLSYSCVNASCLALQWAGASNFRPKFNAPLSVSFFGMVSTLGLIFVVSPLYAGLALAAFLALFLTLHHLLFFDDDTPRSRWGSVSQGILFHQIRKYLLFLDSRKDHVKYWRPQIVLMVPDPRNSAQIIDFINSMKKGGLFILGHVLPGNVDTMPKDPTVTALLTWLRYIDHLRVKAFAEMTVCEDIRTGVKHLVRLSGISAMKPNTLIVGLGNGPVQPETTEMTHYDPVIDQLFPPNVDGLKLQDEDIFFMIQDMAKMGKNICLHRNFESLNYDFWFPSPMRFSWLFPTYRQHCRSEVAYLDVWLVDFFGIEKPTESVLNSKTHEFMLQLACIVSMSKKWKGIKLRVLYRHEDSSEESKAVEKYLTEHLDKYRVKAKIHPVKLDCPDNFRPSSLDDGQNVFDFQTITEDYLKFMNDRIRQESANVTAVSFLPLRLPSKQMGARYIQCLRTLTDQAPPTIFVHGVFSVMSTTL